MVFGAVHMLLFPGDILFLYGLTGCALLAFVMLRARTLASWSAAILALFSYLGLRYLARLVQTEDPASADATTPESFERLIDEQRAEAIAAYTSGSLGDILAAHASQAFLLQSTQLVVLPWVLALFLFGFAIARAGIMHDLSARRTLLRRSAGIALAIGLPANIGLGFYGALAGFGARPASEPAWLTQWADFGQIVGAPVLAVGYLCVLCVLFLGRGAPASLVAVGRMALTAYLLQSALALAVFGGLRLYDRLSSTSALLVVVAIWAVLLAACPLWLRHFRFGPAEWLWRSLAYGRAQPMRHRP
jgi:uncharacterized protein